METEVFLNWLPENISENRLRNALRNFGEIYDVEIKYPPNKHPNAIVTFARHESAEKCCHSGKILCGILNTNVYVNWSNRPKSHNTSYSSNNSSSSRIQKSGKKKCIDPTCGALQNYSPPHGKNSCHACGLGQNLGDQNGEDTKSIVDFDQDITQILKLKQLNMKLKDSMDMTANLNGTDYVDLEKVLKQILDYLDENKALEQDSVLDKIKKAEDFYETCTDMLEKAEEDLKEVLKQSHNAAAIAYHKKLVVHLSTFPYQDMNQLSLQIMQVKAKLMCPRPNVVLPKNISKEITAIIEQISTPMNCMDVVQENPEELLQKLSKSLILIANSIVSDDIETIEAPKVEPILLEVKDILKKQNNVLGKLTEPKILSNQEQGKVVLILEYINEKILSEMVQYRNFYKIAQELCEKHGFNLDVEDPTVSKNNTFECKIDQIEPRELEETLKNEKVEQEDDRLSDVIFPGDDDL